MIDLLSPQDAPIIELRRIWKKYEASATGNALPITTDLFDTPEEALQELKQLLGKKTNKKRQS